MHRILKTFKTGRNPCQWRTVGVAVGVRAGALRGPRFCDDVAVAPRGPSRQHCREVDGFR
jgi:hypothetical protein